MLTLYRIVLYAALPVILLRLLYRGSRNRLYWSRIPQRFAYNTGLPGDSDSHQSKSYYGGVWIHAVSVGEVNAAIPLVKSLKEIFPDTAITITTMTPTGSSRVGKTFGDSVHHCYLPYDYPGAVKRFLNAVRPKLALVMETEIWPNLIDECAKRRIPMIYTNVRLSARSFRGYSKIIKLISPALKKVSQFAVQSSADAARLIGLGADAASINVTGSIKFEMTIPASITEAAQSVRRNLGSNRPVWVAGSTREGEERQIIAAFMQAKIEIANLLLVLVPRHPERFSAVAKLCRRRGCNTILRSETSSNSKISEQTDVYIGDTMGDLTLLIAAGDIAFIGGSLVPTGGHNVLEACAAGVAVIFGPYMFNFQEISNLVLSRGAGIQVVNSDELGEVVARLIQDPVIRAQYGLQGKELIEENKGALVQILNMVRKNFSARDVVDN